VPLPRNIWPGRGAWLAGPSGEESQRSRHERRLAREQALYRKKHHGPVRRALSRLRAGVRRRD